MLEVLIQKLIMCLDVLFQEWLIFLYHVRGLLRGMQLLNLNLPVVIRSKSPGSESLTFLTVHLLSLLWCWPSLYHSVLS